MNDFLIRLFEGNIYLFLLIVPFLGQIGLPLGGMFFILYAGSQVNSPTDFLIFFLIVWLSEMIGDVGSYVIGRKLYDTAFVKKILLKKKIKSMFEKSRSFFDKHGNISVFFSRFAVTAVGPYLNYIAGLEAYDFGKFLLYVTFGEVLYAFELLLLGYLFKETFDEIIVLFTDLSLLVIVGIVLLWIGRTIFKKIAKRLS